MAETEGIHPFAFHVCRTFGTVTISRNCWVFKILGITENFIDISRQSSTHARLINNLLESFGGLGIIAPRRTIFTHHIGIGIHIKFAKHCPCQASCGVALVGLFVHSGQVLDGSLQVAFHERINFAARMTCAIAYINVINNRHITKQHYKFKIIDGTQERCIGNKYLCKAVGGLHRFLFFLQQCCRSGYHRVTLVPCIKHYVIRGCYILVDIELTLVKVVTVLHTALCGLVGSKVDIYLLLVHIAPLLVEPLNV